MVTIPLRGFFFCSQVVNFLYYELCEEGLPSPYGGSFFVLIEAQVRSNFFKSSYRPLTGVLFLFSDEAKRIRDYEVDEELPSPYGGSFFVLVQLDN